MTESHVKTRTMCMQLSVDAARWGAKALKGYLVENLADGTQRDLDGQEVVEVLLRLRDEGLTVAPCGKHECDAKGRCTGVPLEEVPS